MEYGSREQRKVVFGNQRKEFTSGTEKISATLLFSEPFCLPLLIIVCRYMSIFEGKWGREQPKEGVVQRRVST
jgi:hypothetical protein